MRRKRRTLDRIAYLCLIALLSMGILYLLWQALAVSPEYTSEAGIEVTPEKLLRLPVFEEVTFADAGKKIDVNHVGSYRVRVKIGFFTHGCDLTIVDTAKPSVTVKNVVVSREQSVTPEDFTESVNDATDTVITYLTEPDMNRIGETQPITLQVADEGGNTVEVATTLLIVPIHYMIEKEIGSGLPAVEEFLPAEAQGADAAIETDLSSIDTAKVGIHDITIRYQGMSFPAKLSYVDRTPPVFVKAENFTMMAGETINYKEQVTVEDNSGMYSLTVDVDGVDPLKPGTYPLSYTAMDSSGNAAGVVINVTVEQKDAAENILELRVKSILSEILTEDMGQKEKAAAIFDYISSHMTYEPTSEKNGEVNAALQGLGQGIGDCYIYFATAKAMLTQAGIKNMDIQKRPDSSEMHYWNLVDIGDGHGWYHFDVTPHVDHPTIFLWDNKTLMYYSATHNGSHEYDASAYPVIP